MHPKIFLQIKTNNLPAHDRVFQILASNIQMARRCDASAVKRKIFILINLKYEEDYIKLKVSRQVKGNATRIAKIASPYCKLAEKKEISQIEKIANKTQNLYVSRLYFSWLIFIERSNFHVIIQFLNVIYKHFIINTPFFQKKITPLIS